MKHYTKMIIVIIASLTFCFTLFSCKGPEQKNDIHQEYLPDYFGEIIHC